MLTRDCERLDRLETALDEHGGAFCERCAHVVDVHHRIKCLGAIASLTARAVQNAGIATCAEIRETIEADLTGLDDDQRDFFGSILGDASAGPTKPQLTVITGGREGSSE